MLWPGLDQLDRCYQSMHVWKQRQFPHLRFHLRGNPFFLQSPPGSRPTSMQDALVQPLASPNMQEIPKGQVSVP